jgi:aminoglycoside phosphotransferase (APT) family kinase protein
MTEDPFGPGDRAHGASPPVGPEGLPGRYPPGPPGPPGPLIARGRAADVYAHSDGLVLRRYRKPAFLLYEAAVMQWVGSHGYPVPRVVEICGRDLVMERLDGPTMLSDFGRRPWRLFQHAATIANLMKRLHEIPPPDWLLPKQGGGDAIVHLDLHPDNVMLTSKGPVVIDWTNAGRGDPAAEVADLWLVTATAQIPGGTAERFLLGLGRRLFVRQLLSHFDKGAVSAKLRIACEFRSRDRNMSEAEVGRMRQLVERFGT